MDFLRLREKKNEANREQVGLDPICPRLREEKELVLAYSRPLLLATRAAWRRVFTCNFDKMVRM